MDSVRGLERLSNRSSVVFGSCVAVLRGSGALGMLQEVFCGNIALF